MIIEIDIVKACSFIWSKMKEVTGASDWTLTFLLTWLIWLLAGTVFYTYELEIGWAKGFYMAVNIGYSIGWGDISEVGNLSSQWFSTFYVITGASFVAAALGYFAQHIIQDRDNWYENELQRIAYEKSLAQDDINFAMRCNLFINYNIEKIRGIALFLVFIIIATGCAWGLNEDFNFVNGLYFAVSSLSTGGHFSLPSGSSDWAYGLTGLYAAFGVPVMGVAMATLASFFIDTGSISETMELIKTKVTEEECQMLTDFEIANDDNIIDKAEFIILCMVRTGAATPQLISLIIEYFNLLDVDGSGNLSLDEITQRIAETQGKEKSMTRMLNQQTEGLVKEMLHSDAEEDKEDERFGGGVRRSSTRSKRASGGVELSTIDYHVTETKSNKGAAAVPGRSSTDPFAEDSDSDCSAIVRSVRRPTRPSAQQQLARCEEVWQVMCDEKYIKPSFVQELRAILDDVGIYGPIDLADVGNGILALEILPLLKLAPRNRVARLLNIPEEKIEKENYVSPMKAQHMAMQSLAPYPMYVPPHASHTSTSGLYTRSGATPQTAQVHSAPARSSSTSPFSPKSATLSLPQQHTPAPSMEDSRGSEKITEIVLPVRQTRYK